MSVVEESVGAREPRPFRLAAEHRELMAQGANLESGSSARSEERQHEVEQGNEDGTHGCRVSSLGAKAQGHGRDLVFTRDRAESEPGLGRSETGAEPCTKAR